MTIDMIDNLSLQETVALRRKLDADIYHLLIEFKERTGIDIDSISVRHITTMDGVVRDYIVEVTAEL